MLRVDALLAQLPADDPEKPLLQAQAQAYSRECGCAMGGFFLCGASLLTLIYFAVTGDLHFLSVVEGAAFVFVAAALGKATGLLLAWGRLALLGRSLSRSPRRQESGHVYVH